MTLLFDHTTRVLYNLDYTRTFAEGQSKHWTIDPEYNKLFLETQLAYLNAQLKARGHVFLNEVYDVLGFSRVSMGQLIGWVSTDDKPIIFRLVERENNAIEIMINVDGGAMYHRI